MDGDGWMVLDCGLVPELGKSAPVRSRFPAGGPVDIDKDLDSIPIKQKATKAS